MTKYKFKLSGVSPDYAEKEIDIPSDLSVKEVKELVRKAYNLPADLDIQLILPDRPANGPQKKPS